MKCIRMWLLSLLSIPFLILSIACQGISALVTALLDDIGKIIRMILLGIAVTGIAMMFISAIFTGIEVGWVEGLRKIGLAFAMIIGLGFNVIILMLIFRYLVKFSLSGIFYAILSCCGSVIKEISEYFGKGFLSAYNALIGSMMKQSEKR